MKIDNIPLYPILALSVGLSVGRFLTPVKTVVKTEIKTVERVQEVEKNNKSDSQKERKDVSIIEVISPDGTKRTETHISDSKESNSSESNEKTKTQEKEQFTKTESITVKDRKSTQIEAVVATNLDRTLIYGVHISTPILGPVRIGVLGLTDKTFGFTVGAEW